MMQVFGHNIVGKKLQKVSYLFIHYLGLRSFFFSLLSPSQVHYFVFECYIPYGTIYTIFKQDNTSIFVINPTLFKRNGN